MAPTHKNLLLATLLLLLAAASAATRNQQRVTRVQFYMHDVVSGPNATAIRVAGQNSTTSAAANSSDPVGAMFGSIHMFDNPLTVDPSWNSTVVARAQGFYGMASQEDEFALLMSFTVGFVDGGPYNGSTFSVLGRNAIMNAVREMPVVGGTGVFRMARGYCLASTRSLDRMDAVIGYNVTLFHY
ncbi:Dirigent protein 23 [Linum perenne]